MHFGCALEGGYHINIWYLPVSLNEFWCFEVVPFYLCINSKCGLKEKDFLRLPWWAHLVLNVNAFCRHLKQVGCTYQVVLSHVKL